MELDISLFVSRAGELQALAYDAVETMFIIIIFHWKVFLFAHMEEYQ